MKPDGPTTGSTNLPKQGNPLFPARSITAETKRSIGLEAAETEAEMATKTRLVSVAVLWIVVLFGTLALIQVPFSFLFISSPKKKLKKMVSFLLFDVFRIG